MIKLSNTNMLKIMLSCLLCISISTLGKDLSIKCKTGNMRLLLDEEGNLKLNGLINRNEDPIEISSTKKLCLKNAGDIKLALSEDELQIKNNLITNSISEPTENDFLIYNTSTGSQEQPQAVVGTGDPEVNGDLSIAGIANDNMTPVSSVYYMDGEGVFTQSGTSIEFAYANLGGEGRTEYDAGVEQTNLYYIKDHLGSTRMVIDEDGGQVEAFSYTAYGIEKQLVVRAGDPTRERFTGKEFDQEGYDLDNGVAGIQLTCFGARFYDPEIGVFTSADPQEQFFNSYAYGPGNPINGIDPDGELWDVIVAIVGAGIGWYYGGVMGSGGESNPEDWEADAWVSSIMGGISGAMMGYGIGTEIDTRILINKVFKDINFYDVDAGISGAPAGTGSTTSSLNTKELQNMISKDLVELRMDAYIDKPRDCLRWGLEGLGFDKKTVNKFYNPGGDPWAPKVVSGKPDWKPLNDLFGSGWEAQLTRRSVDKPNLAVWSTKNYKGGHAGVVIKNGCSLELRHFLCQC